MRFSFSFWFLLVPLLAFAQQRVPLYGPDSLQSVTLEIYNADNPWAAAVVCPGGSYCWLDYEGEGVEVAQWLQSQGVSAFVLRYRVAGWSSWFFHSRLLFRGHQAPDPYNDAIAALRWVHSHADTLHVDHSSIGIIGFSAGGHLAMSTALNSQFNNSPINNSTINLAFIAPIYPVVTMTEPCVHKRSRRGLLGERRTRTPERMDRWSLERHVTKDCPPIFLVNCVDDPVVDYRNSVLLDSALTAAGVYHLYIQYKTGGHGFGVNPTKGTPESRPWKEEFIKWLKDVRSKM